MLQRSLIVAKHICQKAAKTTNCDGSQCKAHLGKNYKLTSKPQFLSLLFSNSNKEKLEHEQKNRSYFAMPDKKTCCTDTDTVSNNDIQG